MHVVQTDGQPPNHGRMFLLTSGCTWNNKNAPMSVAALNVAIDHRFAADVGLGFVILAV